MIYFTSDLHFNHNKDFIYQARGFENIEEHNKTIVENFNSAVAAGDEVYILGDIMLGDNESGIEYLKQLNGKKHIILGNHDTPARIQLYESLGIDCKYADIIKRGKWQFYLSHYPTLVNNYNEELVKFYCLCGHSHTQDKFDTIKNKCYNVGVDAHENYPINIEYIINDLKLYRKNIYNI